MLSVENLKSSYGRIVALHGVSIMVAAGEIVTLIGANGAGKTTLIARHLRRAADHRRQHTIRGIGNGQTACPSCAGSARHRTGTRRPANCSTRSPSKDNLKLGAWCTASGDFAKELADVYAFSHAGRDLHLPPPARLSGGQQQMLAIGRALMAKPRLLLLDEPSMGLSSNSRRSSIVRNSVRLQVTGLTILLVEQNARAALSIADRAYVLETGQNHAERIRCRNPV